MTNPAQKTSMPIARQETPRLVERPRRPSYAEELKPKPLDLDWLIYELSKVSINKFRNKK